ncbi:50S ribosomal protein L17 [Apibacter sp. B3889]|uniref:50S ribosomal protein L17 n=1 Tax=unclassified Apibacter TaxID=2630820 RepID=UPI00132C0598|nr:MULTISPECIES: 50S ribosomal protein L17 [unclassified Apibacter]MXO34231.1 50S ribosomal protein L17 [Apibacter sp. B3883]MXO41638.1 50S ribosomal protein L17 [Apibacter sp. B3889]MXP03208.1 50S ribosomal protein L17 [Apibacter sp. B3887]MXP07529.1 50S ribosomal protein L17 [Apibacter sp. B3935]
MRHGKKFNHLGRTASHRKAMLSNMAISLILHKRINTTVAKAKALRTYIEPLLTKSKEDTTHNRRTVFSYLQSKEAVTELFRTVATKISSRNGGYCRIIKTGFRLGDGADTALIELVDFNETYNSGESNKKVTRRSRRSTKKADSAESTSEAVVNETSEVESENKSDETKE